MRQLRVAAVGSVDDGKSTLIGRLLYDSKNIFEDQLEHIETVSKRRGDDYLDLSLLTDGLRAEREQGITIDVAHRYFATPKRSFVVLDCPGHIQYTRNMVTGASTADLAIVIVDARHGVIEQTRRHSLLVSLLGVPHLVVCINKMDLVDFSEERYLEIREEFARFASRLKLRDVSFIPISALNGDNVVKRSERLGWYEGPTLLHHLENVYTDSDVNLVDARFPVQLVVRPRTTESPDYRGYAGTMAGGVLRVGDDIVALPSGLTSKIAGIDSPNGSRTEAVAGEAVTLLLEDDISVSRGDLLCRPNNQPDVVQVHECLLFVLDLYGIPQSDALFSLKHTSRMTRAKILEINYLIDVETLHRKELVGNLKMNDVARVSIRTSEPLMCDAYEKNRTTGAFILIDPSSGATVAAGILLGGHK